MFDLIIRGGTLATASDTFAADLGIRDGRIAQIGGIMPEAARVIDATGQFVLPGGIDSHVHLAQPFQPQEPCRGGSAARCRRLVPVPAAIQS